jgi:multidrug efflux pump subunit AcrA (membrane-fusion protein)
MRATQTTGATPFLAAGWALAAASFFALPLTAAEPDKVVLEAAGYLVPARQVTVSPKVAGQILELLVEVGQRVQAGEVLARLDPAGQQAAVRLAQAAVKLAEARVEKAKPEGPLQVAVARAAVDVARARLALAQYHLDCTVVRAPVSGTVLVKRAVAGGFVNPAGYQVPASVCDLADLRAMEVEVWVGERDLARVAKGQPCVVRLDAYPTTSYRGRVARLLPVADRARGAVGVRLGLEVPAGDDHVRPDLRAVVRFLALP